MTPLANLTILSIFISRVVSYVVYNKGSLYSHKRALFNALYVTLTKLREITGTRWVDQKQELLVKVNPRSSPGADRLHVFHINKSSFWLEGTLASGSRTRLKAG